MKELGVPGGEDSVNTRAECAGGEEAEEEVGIKKHEHGDVRQT